MKRLALAALAAMLVCAGCGASPAPHRSQPPAQTTNCRPGSMGAAERCSQSFKLTPPLTTPSGVPGEDRSNNDPSFGQWQTIRRHVAFAYFKVSEGTGFIDQTAARMAREAKAAGLLVGGYDFQRVCGGGAVAEAETFVRAARAAGLLSGPGVLPPTADFEASYGTCSRSVWLREWSRVVRRSVPDAVYSDPGFYIPSVGCSFHEADLGWVADLGGFQPLCGLRTVIHQYSFSWGDGVGSVDGDVFLGSLAHLRALAHITPSKHDQLLAQYRRRRDLLADLHRHGCFHIHGRRAYELCPRWGGEWRATEREIKRLHTA